MESVTETLARVAGEHWFRAVVTGLNAREVGCECGWQQPEDNHNRDRHAAHVATAQAVALDPHFDAARREAVERAAAHMDRRWNRGHDNSAHPDSWVVRGFAAETWPGGE